MTAAIVGLAVFAGATPASASTLARFDTHGIYKWTVPIGVNKVTFDVYGASGGGLFKTNHGTLVALSLGGAGGEAKATFAVKAGQVYEVWVGGSGQATTDGTGGAGGYNSAGYGGINGGGGGGASDVRIGGKGNNDCTADINLICGFSDRIIVGGGGGGGGQSLDGGNGGGLIGGAGGPADGGGGMQEGEAQFGAPCPSSLQTGCFGFGGGGKTYGGGGSGWYGGDGSGGYGGAGGGGGSGYISRYAISGSFPGGTRAGDGLVVIKTA